MDQAQVMPGIVPEIVPQVMSEIMANYDSCLLWPRKDLA
jgi:hypothetical protein